MLWMVAASFMPAGEANAYPPRLLPSALTLAHYATLFTRLDLGRNLINSGDHRRHGDGALAVHQLDGGVRLREAPLPYRERMFRTLSAGLLLPVQIAMLPLFLLFKELGLVNSYWGVIVPSLASIFGIFLVRQYALSMPDDLLDAARIDGAGELRIYWSVVLPVIGPILATIAIWTFLNTWNDFMWPLIVLSEEAQYTLPVALANLSGEHVQDTELMMAGAVVTVLPVMLVFLVLQRYYIHGVMAGSVKG